jgi:hypothetical protein
MRLYTNKKAEWFGTQADAKAAGVEWWEVNVPTDKPSLIRFLNGMSACAGAIEVLRADTPTAAPVVHESTLTKPHPWQTIKECAERAPLRDFPVAIAVYQNRIDELL